jgi:hypothetical protein
MDPYKRTLSIILWGIFLVVFVQLISNQDYKINPTLFIFINVILCSLLIYVIIRKYNVIKFARHNLITKIILFIFWITVDYLLIRYLYNNKDLYNLFGIIVVLFTLILLNISLFFEITD